jgi:ABC-2 type transport system ATP-binding protein
VLGDRADDPIGSFSRGMRQRVALERALVHAPRLLLLDEPFTGLDDASLAALVARLRELRSQGTIVILATHDLDVAENLFDQVVFIRDGRLVEQMAGSTSLRDAYRQAMGAQR